MEIRQGLERQFPCVSNEENLMRWRAVVVALVCSIILVGLISAQSPDVSGKVASVSLIRVIANPQAFDGRRVRVAGYLGNNGLDKAVGIYVTELDGRNFIIMNSVDLGIEESAVSRLVGKYVVLEATYHAPTGPLADCLNGHLDRFMGLRS